MMAGNLTSSTCVKMTGTLQVLRGGIDDGGGGDGWYDAMRRNNGAVR